MPGAVGPAEVGEERTRLRALQYKCAQHAAGRAQGVAGHEDTVPATRTTAVQTVLDEVVRTAGEL